VISSLSVARATSLDAGLIAYLEALAARAYFFVYGARTSLGARLVSFFRHDWPAAVRSLWRETLLAAAILTLAAVAGFVLVWTNPDWYGSIMPEAMTQGRDPTATTAFLRDTLYHDPKGQPLSFFATFLFTHNAQISLFAFALGFVFCLPSGFLMIYNGCTVVDAGTLAQAQASVGDGGAGATGGGGGCAASAQGNGGRGVGLGALAGIVGLLAGRAIRVRRRRAR